MNAALLYKWLWRIGEESDSLWTNVIVAKYNVRRNGGEISDQTLGCSSQWRGIISTKESFTSSIKSQVSSRGSISFWHDTWVGERPFAAQFPELYSCTRDRQTKVNDYMERTPLQILWGPIFIRNLQESDESEFLYLLDALYQTSIPEES